MINKIKRRIMIATLLSVFIVLVGVIGIMNISSYHTILNDADNILNVLVENGGTFPNIDNTLEGAMFYQSQELPYEIRYFSIHLDKDGVIDRYDLNKIAAIDQVEAVQITYDAITEKSNTGFIQNYRYRKLTTSDGGILAVFLDCGRNLSMFHNTLQSSITYGCFGFLVVVLLSFFLSHEAVYAYINADKLQREFITNAGHEIKTPIAVITADAQALELDYGKNDWCDDIQIQAGRLERLTKDLITLTKMEEIPKSGEYQVQDISEALKKAAASFVSTAVTQSKEYMFSVSDTITMACDPKDIVSLFDILADNAIKYSEGPGNIIATAQQDRMVTISVSNDVSEDMDPAITEHMFERFYRGDKSHNSLKEGYGIGLAMARAICKKYGGTIKADVRDRRITITAAMKGQKNG